MKREDGTVISNEAIVDWKHFFRDICSMHFEKNPITLDGSGSIVEIDETVIIKRKYHKGKRYPYFP